MFNTYVVWDVELLDKVAFEEHPERALQCLILRQVEVTEAEVEEFQLTCWRYASMLKWHEKEERWNNSDNKPKHWLYVKYGVIQQCDPCITKPPRSCQIINSIKILKEEILSFKWYTCTCIIQYHWVFLTHLYKGKKVNPMESYLLRKRGFEVRDLFKRINATLFFFFQFASMQLTVLCVVQWASSARTKDRI